MSDKIKATRRRRVTILTPFYNEEGNLPELRRRLCALMDKMEEEVDVVLIDDHSSDGSSALAEKWAREDDRVRYVRFSRNFGSHAAYVAGLKHVQGDCAIFLCSDLQDPPENIPELVRKWRDGHDIVWAIRRGDGARKAMDGIFARIANKIIEWVLPEWPQNGSDFALLDRKVVRAYNRIDEKNASLHCTLAWMGFRQGTIEFDREPRRAGKSKWGFYRKIKLLIDVVVSFSYAPIRAASVGGMVACFLGSLFAIHVVHSALSGSPNPGWASLMVVTLLLGGFQLVMLGILGEYLWRTYDESRGRPRFVVEKVVSRGNAKAVRLRKAS